MQYIWIPLGLLSILILSSCENKETKLYPLTESWEKVIPHQSIPVGLQSISAEHCGSCHQDHYKEWQTSTHAHAWSDAQFQSELSKESSPFFCINCHIPLQNQQEFIVRGKIGNDIYQPSKISNPHFDKSLQEEAITCAVCHVRDGVIIAMNGNMSAPHKTVGNPSFLSEQLCISCHNASAHISEHLVCSFETGDEWKAGAYFGKKNCISCHMEEVRRPLMNGLKSRLSHFHNFPGSGIPKVLGEQPGVLNGLAVELLNKDVKYVKGNKFKGKVSLKNEYAGHRVPTGDPERFFLLSQTLLYETNDTISHQEYRIGEKWQWHPTVKKLGDNNFEVGEERNYGIEGEMRKKGNYKWNIALTKHRMDNHTAIYNKLGKEYPIFIKTYNKSVDIVVE